MRYIFLLFPLFMITTVFGQFCKKADSCFTEANKVFQIGNYQKAGELFLKSAEYEKQCIPQRYNDYSYEMNNAALCFKAIGDYKTSVYIYSELIFFFDSLKIDSLLITPQFELANIYRDEGNYTKALELLEAIRNSSYLTNNNATLIQSYQRICDIYITTNNKAKFFSTIDTLGTLLSDTAFMDLSVLNFQKAKYYSQNYFYDMAHAYASEAINFAMKGNTKKLYLADLYLELSQIAINIKKKNPIPFLDSAITIYNSLGQYAGLATALNTKGTYLSSQLHVDEALNNYNSALQVYTDLHNLKGIASVNLNIADLKKNLGEYETALAFLEKAYHIYLSINDTELSNLALSNIGNIYISQSKYDKAIECYNRALHSNSSVEDLNTKAIIYNNIGGVYTAWGQYDKALSFYQKSIAIQKSTKNYNEYATCLNNIGGIYELTGQYEKAIEQYKQALQILKSTNETVKISTLLNNIGGIYYSMLQYEKALTYYENSLQLSTNAGSLTNIALVNDNMGNILLNEGNSTKAKEKFIKALEIRRNLDEKSGIASTLNNLAVTYIKEENYSEAITLLSESVEILETLRLTAKEDVRRDYMNNQILAYQNLIIALIKTKKYDKAFYYNELSRAKQLAEQISKQGHVIIPTLGETQNSIDDSTAIIIFSTVDNTNITTFLITKTGTNITSKNKELILKQLLEDNDVKEIVLSKLTLAEIIRLQQFIVSDNGNNTINQTLLNKVFSNIIKAYSTLLNSPVYKDVVKTKKLSESIYGFLLADIESHFITKKKLLIMQDGILGYLPFETLLNSKKEYLVENFDISYVNSFSVRKLISERNYSNEKVNLLAMGVSEYDKASTAPQPKYALSISDLKTDIYQAIELNLPLERFYERIGYTRFNNLKASTHEIKTISEMFPNSSQLLNSEVTEKNIKDLSESGQLKKFTFLHFSTHGISVPEIPELSSLVLYKFDKSGNNDGFLRMGEIANLDINADYVNLSACETGLGKVYSGEGVVGLAQAFLTAGANSLSASLWQVDESSTAEFMKSLYSKAIANNFNFAKAINEVKREFIRGDKGVAWKLPYFWAPFIFYGN